MKKSDKKTELNHVKPLSDNNESNLIIDGADEFVLFPLDVQEANTTTTIQITPNTAAFQDDDFILFPLDVKKTRTNTNNPAPITNQKTNKPKRQYVTKPNPQPANPPKPSPITVNRPTNKKLRNIFWFIVISLSIYTFINKEPNESYLHFFSKTSHKIGNVFNNLKSNFIDEDDFIEFKKDKKIIYSPYIDYIEDDSGEINEVKGDSIIIIESTENKYKAFYLPAGKTFKLKVGRNEYSLARIAENNIYLDVNQKEFEKLGDWNRKISVFIENENSTFSQEIIINKIDIAIDKEERIEIRYMRNRIEDFKSNTILTKYVSKSLLEQKDEISILPKENDILKNTTSNTKITVNIFERSGVFFDEEGWPVELGKLKLINNFQEKNIYQLEGYNYIEKIEIFGQSKDITLQFLDAIGNKIVHEEKSISLNGTKTYTSTDPAGNKDENYKKWLVKDGLIIKVFQGKELVFNGKINHKINNKANASIKSDKKIIQKKTTPTTIKNIDDNNIYNTAGIEVKPDFPGGLEKFYKFISKNFQVPEEEGLKGKVFVTFVVEKDGLLSDIKVLRDIGYGTGKEAVRVLKSSPRWEPGEQNGKKVRCIYSLPISIQSSE
jgi:hypothetical protein